jgi:hypothetical protein
MFVARRLRRMPHRALQGVFLHQQDYGYTDATLRLDNTSSLLYGPGNTNVLAVFVDSTGRLRRSGGATSVLRV